MTPKEQANELLEKYANSLPSIFYNVVESKNYHSAKRCALIAVDLAISIENSIFDGIVHTSYWQKVKREINKL